MSTAQKVVFPWLATLVVAGCVGRSSGIQSEAIVGGTSDTGDQSVLFMLMSVGGQYESCTAELISPHVALTAAHCVMPDPSQGSSGTVTWNLYVGNVFTPGDVPPNALAVKEAHASPLFNYAADAGQGIHDIGVAVLAQPAPVSPLPYNRKSLPASATGAATRLVGFGLSNGAAMTGAGTKRQTSTALTDFDADKLHFADGQHQDCSGDSGGPAFQTIDGVEIIIGTTSGPGMNPNDTCKAGGYDTRVDTNSDFIDQYVNANDPGFLQADMGAALPGGADGGSQQDMSAVGGSGTGGGGAGNGGAGGGAGSGGANGSSNGGGNGSGCSVIVGGSDARDPGRRAPGAPWMLSILLFVVATASRRMWRARSMAATPQMRRGVPPNAPRGSA